MLCPLYLSQRSPWNWILIFLSEVLSVWRCGTCVSQLLLCNSHLGTAWLQTAHACLRFCPPGWVQRAA